MEDDPKLLPPVSDLEMGVRVKVMNLMDELAEVTGKLAPLNEREAKLKEELNKLREEQGRPGFRYGNLTFQAIRVSGRRTLDKMLLLENGCPIRVLEESYKEGKPSQRIVFKELEE